MRIPLLQHLQNDLLVADGAMGTMIYSHGIPLSQSFDQLNLTQPELILGIHRAYVEAGAQALETNSFTANRKRLARFGLENHVREINLAAVRLARTAAGGQAYVLASIGPVRDRASEEMESVEIRRLFAEQIAALVEGEPDALIFETFTVVSELEIAVEEARRLSAIPVIAQVVADEEGYTGDGQHLTAIFKRLRTLGAAVVGINCAKGPAGILKALREVPLEGDLVLSAFPNAGLPAYVDGRYIYLSTPEYFGEAALKLRQQGVRLIGGCCGTTPEHIKAMADSLRGLPPVTEKIIAVRPAPSPPSLQQIVPPEFLAKVKSRPAIIVELDPPRDLDCEPVLQGAHALKRAGIDALTMADSSLGITRMNNLALGALIKQQVDVPLIIHLACRDRNLIGLQSELMGLHALGLHTVLALTGDPAKFGDQPGATSVFDLNSFGLVEMIKRMNQGIAFSGRAMKQGTRFVVGVAFNPNVDRLDTQVRRLHKKIQAGADFVMTQPIFDWRMAKELHTALRDLDLPVFVGIMPLVSGRNADFLHNEVPGIRVPERIRKRLFRFEGERARREGVTIAAEILESVLDYFNGIYLITPFVRYEMCLELIEKCRALVRRRQSAKTVRVMG
ncbi:MAG: bifunctional homocysteine S-methyltransferase/methylenetetrahydrofolate reductase [candidate division KSB1 bacterium]|nr:bifunctional homocysteine S-methyltransferase/methylenetetrahydrofolate reductase [candidate division KSB1 bacterium]MDZ7275539.1 bifunctional homocysteine S-methyltransferase/methylenetetrahydrofolate reductase [candidate division KSB1 bacterium]MDZ7286149.1 bifunctional homocysteine S-methyltransferase/methylenetetrahydrofolate reductase [candidate division KSB1 bacterium]MDZ7296375.1 bifunctional homocysteine S-methyltransferase/methylenetetrahydrofolate reductase [candidate division KSB1 